MINEGNGTTSKNCRIVIYIFKIALFIGQIRLEKYGCNLRSFGKTTKLKKNIFFLLFVALGLGHKSKTLEPIFWDNSNLD